MSIENQEKDFFENEENMEKENSDIRDLFGEDPMMEGNLPEEEVPEEVLPEDEPTGVEEPGEPVSHDHFFEDLRKAREKAGEEAEPEDYFFDPKRAAKEAAAAAAAAAAAEAAKKAEEAAQKKPGGLDEYEDEWKASPKPSTEPDEELALKIRRRRSRRSRKKFLRRTLLLIVALAVLVTGALLFIDKQGMVDIKKITVEGNAHYTAEEIIKASGIHKKAGLITLRTGKARNKIMELPYVKSARISRQFPHTAKITVAERVPVFAVQAGGFFLIIDDENRILEKANDPGGVMIVEGFIPTTTEPGQEFAAEKANGVKNLLDLADQVENQGMGVYKVSYLNGVTRVYLTKNIVCEGKYDNIKANVAELGEIMSSLHEQGIERATIYIGDNGYISFSPKI
ncbi:MAG: FtsQ-type POTRA domain-containing protein [Firmicutes bacterium]|nr:FtsQ-type POTRA domain-containing protein [Bacillota bacterium]